MRRRVRIAAFLAAVIAATAAVGCGGGEEVGTVTNDVSKDPKLLDAMGGYMKSRPGSRPSSDRAAP